MSSRNMLHIHGHLVLQQSPILTERQEGRCDCCDSPISQGDWRWLEVGSEDRQGTLVVGCSLECCVVAAYDFESSMKQHNNDRGDVE